MYLDLLQLDEVLDEFLYEFGYQLVDLKLAGNRSRRVFRLFVDRVDGEQVLLDDCGELAPQVVMFLEMKGVYNDQCSLELSSAGVDRVLKRDRDFERFLGSEVKLRYREDTRHVSLVGELTSFTDEVLVITPIAGGGADQAISIQRENLEKVNLVPKLEI